MSSRSEKVFRGAYQTHYRAILAFAIRRTPSRVEAEDITAETFLVAWRRADRLPDVASEQKLWLFSIARNVLSNHYRGHSRARRLSELLRTVEVGSEEAADSFVEDQSDLVDAFDALSALSDKDREILLLNLWEDLTVAEIAKVMNLSRPNVSVRLHRARNRLRTAFATQMQEHDASGHVPPRRATGDVAEQESTG